MKTKLVKIGNSRGVRLPRSVIEQAGLTDEIELVVEGTSVVLRSVKPPRAGWDEAFADMARAGDDALLLADGASTQWDEEEWEW